MGALMQRMQKHVAVVQLLFLLTEVSVSSLISPCVDISYGHAWQQGQDGQLTITFPEEKKGWRLKLEFDQPINALRFYNGRVKKKSSTRFIIRHQSYNKKVEAGGTVTSGWQATFNNLENVRIVKAQLVGVDCSAVTTVEPTTAPTTTSDTTTPTTISTTETTTTSSTISTTESMTTTAATSTTNTATEEAEEDCITISHGNGWNQGQDGSMKIVFPDNVDSWEITVEFDMPLKEFNFYQGVVTKVSETTYTIKNQNWNSEQSAGSVIESRWQAQFETSNTPAQMGSATFVGISCSTTTTDDSGTTASTTVLPSTSTLEPTTPSTVQPTTSTDGTTSTTEAPTTVTTTDAGSTTTASTCDDITKYNYDEVIELSNLFYQAQRSGKLNKFGDFNTDKIPYRGDSALGDGGDNKVDLEGGYYDAGDFVKFNFPMAASTTLLAWGAIDFSKGYSAADQTEKTLNTIKWATDYFIKCHTGPNELYAQVGDGNADHSQWTRVEDMTIPRPSYKIDASKPGSDLAGETAAAL